MNRVNNPAGLLRPDDPFFGSCAEVGIEIEVGRLPTGASPSPEQRQRESAATRELARQMLRRHGVIDADLARHPEGFPLCPPGWIGSMSHSAGWGAFALARETAVRGIGVDIEDSARMLPDMWAHILTATESRSLGTLDRDGAAQRATALFSAKEAVFKALYPLHHRAPGFHEVEIEWRASGEFYARVIAGQGGPGLTSVSLPGRWASQDGLVLAACWVPR